MRRWRPVDRPEAPTGRGGGAGFTLLELLVTMTVIALLAGLLLSAVSQAKARGQGIACLNNVRQVAVGWQMYPDDNAGKLVLNVAFNGAQRTRLDSGGWIRGWLDFAGSNPDNTNQWKLVGTVDGQTALLGRYIPTPAVYKCPSDRSTVTTPGGRYPRVRSISMSQAIGYGSTGTWLPPSIYHVFQRESEIVHPAPANLLVLLDEHPDSINDGGWAFHMYDPDQRALGNLVDLPASFHGGAGAMTFADGHAELHKWLDARTRPRVRYQTEITHVATPFNPDADWLAARISSRRDGSKPWW